MVRASFLSLSLLIVVACSQATPSPGESLAPIVVTPLVSGDAQCPQGGAQIQADESTGFSCNGTPGRDAVLQQAFRPFTDGTLLDQDGNWTELVGSVITTDTTGGNLQVFLDVTVRTTLSRGQVSCRPTVDGVWLGEVAGIPENGGRGEGVSAIIERGPYLWSKTRIYRGLAAGKHRFALQCSGTTQDREDGVSACGYVESTCAWGFLELNRPV